MHFTIDFTQVAIQAIAIMGTIATPILTVLVLRLAAKIGSYFHMQVSAQNQKTIIATIDNGIAWAEAQGDAVARDKGKVAVTDQNVALVMNQYVLPHAMQALAKEKLPASHLGELIAAKLQQKLSAIGPLAA